VRIVFELLQRYGYADNNSGAIIHSFEPTTLRRLRELGWRAQLELAFGEGKAADGSDFEYLASADGLTELRTYVDSVWAPAKRMFNWDAEGELHLNSFTHDAKSAGLTVYGGVIAPEELPANCPSIDAWHDALVNAAQVDGVVTDFPDVTRTWLQKQRGETTL
jgi:glycerophosphoryl diester phosphodiesterase